MIRSSSFSDGQNLAQVSLESIRVITALAVSGDQVLALGSPYPSVLDSDRPSLGLTIIRFNNDRSLDSSFGQSGIVIDVGDGSSWYITRALSVLADGKIIVGGSYSWFVDQRPHNPNIDDGRRTQSAILVARYNPDGSPDVSFGNGGRVTIGLPDGNTSFRSLGIMHNGTVVVGGGQRQSPELDRPLLVAIDTTGQIDHSFVARAANAWTLRESSWIWDMTMMDDDSMVVLRNRNGVDMLERYLADGSRDEAFLEGREVAVTIPSAGWPSVLRDGRGGFLVAWCPARDSKTQLRRFASSGELDTQFGVGGAAEVDVCMGGPGAVEVDSLGRVLLVGARNGSGVVARLREDGVTDESFGEHGLVVFGGDVGELSSVLPLGGNRLVLGGRSTSSSSSGARMLVAWLE